MLPFSPHCHSVPGCSNSVLRHSHQKATSLFENPRLSSYRLEPFSDSLWRGLKSRPTWPSGCPTLWGHPPPACLQVLPFHSSKQIVPFCPAYPDEAGPACTITVTPTPSPPAIARGQFYPRSTSQTPARKPPLRPGTQIHRVPAAAPAQPRRARGSLLPPAGYSDAGHRRGLGQGWRGNNCALLAPGRGPSRLLNSAP